MKSITLNRRPFSVPASKKEFSEFTESLAAEHGDLRAKVLLFFLRSKSKTGEGKYVASMVGEGKYGTLHLLYELLGRPNLSERGFIESDLSAADVSTLVDAFSPFDSEAGTHPNIDFLKAAQADGSQVTGAFIEHASANSQPEYMKFRTNAMFDLFNEGALRGSDGVARQALLDSFSYLPNRFLSADGRFIVAPNEEANFIREAAGYETVESGAKFVSAAGIDKFPSLLAVRAARLLADGNRIVPSVMIRDGVHVGKRNIFMFHAAVNLAAFIGDDNMVDSHASIASAAQIGNKNKIGSFVSVEGVLSPANAQPVYIGNENFIGTAARIGTGIVLGDRNFIAAGVNISLGTKLKDCREGSPTYGNYISAHELNGSFNRIALAPNNADRQFNGVTLKPGEYICFENSEEFMQRFDGDDRIKAK